MQLILLGPQRPFANAPQALAELDATGPIAVIAAGWRHDESDEAVIQRHLGPQAHVLPLYAWFDTIMVQQEALRAEYRARQEALKELRTLHRLRLDRALAAMRDLLAHPAGEVSDALTRQALDDVRRIDRQLVNQTDAIMEGHGRPWDDDLLVAERQQQAREILEQAQVIVLVGGDVAVLRSRLAFFRIGQVLAELYRRGTVLVEWSAGAMALTERIVLFYDDPPDGPANPEIFDRGEELVPGLVMLPHARQRLDLEDPQRVRLLAQRLAPATCLGLENGAWLVHTAEGWFNRGPARSATRLGLDGRVQSLPTWRGA
ncbi:MAG: Type 1 glutamine amidotransferase-like domain-containing protein [Myxococcota bacterium]